MVGPVGLEPAIANRIQFGFFWNRQGENVNLGRGRRIYSFGAEFSRGSIEKRVLLSL